MTVKPVVEIPRNLNPNFLRIFFSNFSIQNFFFIEKCGFENMLIRILLGHIDQVLL